MRFRNYGDVNDKKKRRVDTKATRDCESGAVSNHHIFRRSDFWFVFAAICVYLVSTINIPGTEAYREVTRSHFESHFSSSSSSSLSNTGLPTSKVIYCNQTAAKYLICEFSCDCVYGMPTTANCTINNTTSSNLLNCTGPIYFERQFVCQFCFQAPDDQQICTGNSSCYSTRVDPYVATCTVADDYLCMGK